MPWNTTSAMIQRLLFIRDYEFGGHPEHNPPHERMHRTLKAATSRPPAANHRAQQRAFNTFQAEFNTERPHESLAMEPPATLYRESPRPYRGPVEPLE